MTVLYHPEFARDIGRFARQYGEISPRLGLRLAGEVDLAIAAIKAHPAAAGHFLNTGSVILREVRRRNLEAFPLFVLYGLADERLVFGSLVPSSADPLTWLNRLGAGHK